MTRAHDAGLTMATMAVAGVLQNPAITAPIVGASRSEQLDDTIAAVATMLDDDLVHRLDEYRRGDVPR